MGANQEGVHLAVRNSTGTTGTYLEDWHALFDADGITAGPWGNRMIAWVNGRLGTSYTNLNEAMTAFAIDQGFERWQDMNTLSLSAALALLAGETDGLAIDFTDDAYFSREGFYGSLAIKDTVTPANEYDSSPTTTSASKLTYTSPSVKMCMGPAGTLRYGAHNLVNYSELASSWSLTSLTAPNATDFYEVAATSSHYALVSQVSTVAGATYAFSIEVQSIGGRRVVVGADSASGRFSGATLTLDLSGAGSVVANAGGASNVVLALQSSGWYLLTFTATAASSGAESFGVGTTTTTGYASFLGDITKGLMMRKAHVRRTPSDSTYLTTTSAARYALPLEWSSAGVLQGLLCEESRTNLVLYSSTTLASGWSPTGITNLTTTTTGADGVSGTATQLNEDTSTGGHQIAQNFAKAASAITYTFSFIAKVGTGRTRVTAFLTTDAFANYFGAAFDLSGGQTSAFTTAGASPWTSQSKTITSLGGGQYLCTLTGTSNATSTNLVPYIYSDNGSGTAAISNSFTGVVGNGCYIGDIQLEVGAFATSRIRTFASTVTRAVDNISLATSAFPYSQTEGTLFVEINNPNISGGYPVMVHNGTGNESILFYKLNTTDTYFYVVDGGAAQVNLLTAALTTNATSKIAGVFNTNDFASVANGGTVQTDATGTLPTVTTLNIGSGTSGSNSLNSYIRKLMILPRRMSNADIDTLTT